MRTLTRTPGASNVGTRFCGVGFSSSSSTRRTTKKSMRLGFPPNTLAQLSYRSGLATIRSMGIFLCPRCLTVLDQVSDIGKNCDCARRRHLRNYAKDAARVEDARRIIFDMGMSVGGELGVLKNGSLIPTRVIGSPHHLSTFAHTLQNAYYSELGANPAELMPVDPLHDWELGVGKGVCMHNVRILHAIGRSAINLFDARWVPKSTRHAQAINPPSHRFRQVPTFGRDTIRKFGGSVSAMKKLAGRDFEDILQVRALLQL